MPQQNIFSQNYDYADWVSNVSGRLLFRLTSPFNYRNDRIVGDVIHYNHKFPITKKRIIVVSMLIDIRDEKIGTNYRNFTRVIFIAHTDDESVRGDRYKKKLYGDIFFITPKMQNKFVLGKEKELIQALDTAVKDGKMHKEILKDRDQQVKKEEENIKHLSVELKDKVLQFLKDIENAESHIYHSSVCIKDTGFIYFQIQQSREDAKEIISQQAFYFIKYLFHKHVFHSVTQENITKLQPPDSDGFGFAQKLLSYIKHHITEIRNQKSTEPKYLQNLKGVISYANSLLNNLKREKLIDIEDKEQREYYELEKSYLQNIHASLENALIIHPYKSSSIIDFKNDLFATALFVFAMTAPYVIFKAKESTAEFIFDVYLPAYSIAFVIALSLTFFISLLIHGREQNYFVQISSKLWNWIFRVIKKKNNITIKPKNYLSKICSAIISTEMLVRRTEFQKSIKMVMVITLVSISLMGYLLIKLISHINLF